MKNFKHFAIVAIMMAGAAVSLTSCGGSFFNEPSFLTSPTGSSTAFLSMESTLVDSNNELSKKAFHNIAFSVNEASTRSVNFTFSSQVRDAKDEFVKNLKNKMRMQLAQNPSLKNSNVKVKYTVCAKYSTSFKRNSEIINGVVNFSEL